MNNTEYKKLCKYCDNILSINKDSVSGTSYSKIHVIKNHPEFNKEYFLGQDKNTSKLNKSFYGGIINYIKNYFFEKPNAYLNYKRNYTKDVLIISSLINYNHLNSNEDFYFGSLSKHLKKKNFSSKIVLRNETAISGKVLFKSLNKDKIILSKRMSLFNELIFILKAIREFFKFNLNYEKFKLKEKSLNFFSFRSFGHIIPNLRLATQINQLVKIIKPKYIIITFEGHAWERIAIMNIKKKHRNTKIFAYQFSVVTKNHHALFRPLHNNLNPDCILTTGKFTKNIFKNKYKCPVKIIGSKKSIKNNFKLISKNNKKVVLILPEAYISESKILLNFAVKVSKLYKNYKFYLRLHPMIDFKELNFDLSKHPNIELSNLSLEKDFKRSGIIFFRGSASSLEATSYGLKPIYIGNYNRLNINPLFQVMNKRYYLTKPKDFKKVAENFNLIELKKINNYSNNYFKKMKLSKNLFEI